MALTNKQAAARIVKKVMTDVESVIDGMDSKSIVEAAEKSRLTDEKVAEVKEYAKAFLKPTLDRVTKICDKLDSPQAAE